jgi:hypothetical protein
VKPVYVTRDDWNLIRTTIGDTRGWWEFIAAWGYLETQWGKTGELASDCILGIRTIPPGLANLPIRGLENQLKYAEYFIFVETKAWAPGAGTAIYIAARLLRKPDFDVWARKLMFMWRAIAGDKIKIEPTYPYPKPVIVETKGQKFLHISEPDPTVTKELWEAAFKDEYRFGKPLTDEEIASLPPLWGKIDIDYEEEMKKPEVVKAEEEKKRKEEEAKPVQITGVVGQMAPIFDPTRWWEMAIDQPLQSAPTYEVPYLTLFGEYEWLQYFDPTSSMTSDISSAHEVHAHKKAFEFLTVNILNLLERYNLARRR